MIDQLLGLCSATAPPFPSVFGSPFGSSPPAFADSPGDATSALFSSLLTPGSGGGTFTHGADAPVDPGGGGGGDSHVPNPGGGGSGGFLDGEFGGGGGGGAGGGGAVGIPFGKVGV